MTMVELNEKSLEAAKIARAIAMNMLNEGTQWRLDPRYLLILCDAVEGSSLPAPGDGLVERLRVISTDMPGHIDAGDVWDAATALQSQAEQIERLKHLLGHGDLDRDAENYALEQQVQKLTAENERLREALRPLGALAAAVFRTEDGREMNAQKADDTAVWGFDWVELTYGHLRSARSALETQEGGK